MRRSIGLGILLFALQAAANATTLDLMARKTLADEHPRGTRFDICGQILLVCDGHPRRVTIMDRQEPKTLTFWDESDGTPPYRSGDVISAVCIVSNSPPIARRESPNQTNAYFLSELTVIAPRQPPPPTTSATAQELNANGRDGSFTAISGVISAVMRDPTNQGWLWVLLRANGATMRAAATEHDYSFEKLNTLVNAQVRLSGIPVPFFAWRRPLGYHLVLFGFGGLNVIKPPRAPFDAPRLTSLYRQERQQVSGLVIGTGVGRVFLSDDNGRFLTALTREDCERPEPGERVTVSGFAEPAPLGIQLSNAVLRRDSPETKAPIPPAPDVDPESMFSTDRERELADATLYGKVIRIRGQVDDALDAIRANGRFSLKCGRRTLSVDVSGLTEPLPDGIDAGSLVAVSGICLADFDMRFDQRMFPTFRGFELLPRTAADIVVVRRPPFWTAGRLTGVIAVLALALAVVVVWNRMLKTLSERRGRELMAEQVGRVTSDLRVNERTRIAVELHDALSQNLTGVSLQLDAVRRFADEDRGKMSRHLDMATRTLKSCREELRNCLWDLRNRALEETDMNEAIRRTASPFVGDAKLVIRFNVPRSRLSDDTAHALMRIVRELASNAVRHGGAKTIRIAGALDGGELRVSVRDDGAGFDPAHRPGVGEGHFGLEGIRERLSRVGGTLSLESAPGQGANVTLTLPS